MNHNYLRQVMRELFNGLEEEEMNKAFTLVNNRGAGRRPDETAQDRLNNQMDAINTSATTGAGQ